MFIILRYMFIQEYTGHWVQVWAIFKNLFLHVIKDYIQSLIPFLRTVYTVNNFTLVYFHLLNYTVFKTCNC